VIKVSGSPPQSLQANDGTVPRKGHDRFLQDPSEPLYQAKLRCSLDTVSSILSPREQVSWFTLPGNRSAGQHEIRSVKQSVCEKASQLLLV
jgi:hypothetical protein